MPEGYMDFSIYNTVDYETLFIFVFQAKNNVSQVSNLEPEWKVTGSMLQESMQLSNQFLIYQTSVSQLDFFGSACYVFHNGSGFYCDFVFKNLTVENFPTVKVTFFSSGQITGTGKDIELNFNSNFGIITLKYGDVIVGILRDHNGSC